jgi:hypothetical protein
MVCHSKDGAFYRAVFHLMFWPGTAILMKANITQMRNNSFSTQATMANTASLVLGFLQGWAVLYPIPSWTR